MTKILTPTDHLNPPQLQAVTASPGNLLILAGAGSGKTRVLVQRIAWLLQTQPISPANILAVTFTNKAAREMRTRLESFVDIPMSNMWIGTFHSLAHRFLRLHHTEASLNEDFQILDADDQLRLIKQVHKNLNLPEEQWPPKKSQWFINHCKDEGLRPKDITQDSFTNQTLIKVYQDYQKLCNNNNLLDFADLLLVSYETLREQKTLLEQYQQRFQHILVDEFQDTNHIQYQWLKLLAKNSFFMAVGDDDQSIYGWRGARVENMRNSLRDFPNMQTISLEQNYRSTANILKAANTVIANNTSRLSKELWTQGPVGELITVYNAFDELDEARFIAEHIEQHVRQGDYADVAVLYRSNAQSRVIEDRLVKMGIPYQVYGGLRFFERAEVKDALAYLRLISNRNDNPAFERAITTPSRGVGTTSLESLRKQAREHDISLWQAAQQALQNNMFTARTANPLQNFMKFIDEFALSIKDLELDKQIAAMLNASGLYEYYKNDRTEKGRMRVENLDELINAGRTFVPDHDHDLPVLTNFLACIALDAAHDTEEDKKLGVHLMTLHSAKGLEFPVVFLTGLEQGLFPHQLSMTSDDEMEEERRLCYVGMTRAQHKLYLTYAQIRRIHGSEQRRLPSKFLAEIPRELVTVVGDWQTAPPTNTYQSYRGGSAYTRTNFETNNVGTTLELSPLSTSNPSSGLQLGQRVRHAKFGEGIVVDLADSGENLRAHINFRNFGRKWLMASHPSLKTIN